MPLPILCNATTLALTRLALQGVRGAFCRHHSVSFSLELSLTESLSNLHNIERSRHRRLARASVVDEGRCAGSSSFRGSTLTTGTASTDMTSMDPIHEARADLAAGTKIWLPDGTFLTSFRSASGVQTKVSTQRTYLRFHISVCKTRLSESETAAV
jgi:hypothetical protein